MMEEKTGQRKIEGGKRKEGKKDLLCLCHKIDYQCRQLCTIRYNTIEEFNAECTYMLTL